MAHHDGLESRIVVPRGPQDARGLRSGDSIMFGREDGAVPVRRADASRALLGRFSGSDLLGDLAARRAADRDGEDARG